MHATVHKSSMNQRQSKGDTNSQQRTQVTEHQAFFRKGILLLNACSRPLANSDLMLREVHTNRKNPSLKTMSI